MSVKFPSKRAYAQLSPRTFSLLLPSSSLLVFSSSRLLMSLRVLGTHASVRLTRCLPFAPSPSSSVGSSSLRSLSLLFVFHKSCFSVHLPQLFFRTRLAFPPFFSLILLFFLSILPLSSFYCEEEVF